MSKRTETAFDDGQRYCRLLDDLYCRRDQALRLNGEPDKVIEWNPVELLMINAVKSYTLLKELEAKYPHISKADKVFGWFNEEHSKLCQRFASRFPLGQRQENYFDIDLRDPFSRNPK